MSSLFSSGIGKALTTSPLGSNVTDTLGKALMTPLGTKLLGPGMSLFGGSNGGGSSPEALQAILSLMGG